MGYQFLPQMYFLLIIDSPEINMFTLDATIDVIKMNYLS